MYVYVGDVDVSVRGVVSRFFKKRGKGKKKIVIMINKNGLLLLSTL